MPRVKGGTVTRRRRKKILKLAKGYFGSKRALYRTAHEQVMHSLAYAYRDRKQRKREFRKLWITRINAAAKANGMKYSKLIHGLSLAHVEVNRKMLADIAINAPEDFTAYCDMAKAALEGHIPASTEKKVEAKKVQVKAEPKVEKEAPKKAEKQDYASLLVADLKALCKERNIEGYTSMKKAELVQALEASDK